MPGHRHIIVEGAGPGGKVPETYLVMCLPLLPEVRSHRGVIKPLNSFQAWGLTNFCTKRIWDRTNRYFDLGLTLNLGEVSSGPVALPQSVCFFGGFVCFF